MGASIYDVSKIFGILDPLPPCPHLGVLNSRNLPYYIFFWDNPPPPLSADVIYGCPLFMTSNSKRTKEAYYERYLLSM